MIDVRVCRATGRIPYRREAGGCGTAGVMQPLIQRILCGSGAGYCHSIEG